MFELLTPNAEVALAKLPGAASKAAFGPSAWAFLRARAFGPDRIGHHRFKNHVDTQRKETCEPSAPGHPDATVPVTAQSNLSPFLRQTLSRGSDSGLRWGHTGARLRRGPLGKRGATTLEFALVGGLFVLLLLGTIELSR